MPLKLLSTLLPIFQLLSLTTANIFPVTSRPNNPDIPGRSMISYAPNQNHIVSITTANLSLGYGDRFHFMFIDYNNNNYSYTTILLTTPAVSARSNHENYNDPVVGNRRFLILDSTRTVVMVYNSTAQLSNFAMNGTVVVDYCLETNRQEFYTLERTNVAGTPYQLGYYLIASNWSRKINITENYDPTQKPLMKCLRSSLFLNFTDKVRVYSLNQSLWNIKTIKNHGNLSNLHSFGQILTVGNSTHILLFNSSANYSLAKTIPKNISYTYFCSLYFGSNTYLYILRRPLNSTGTLIAQYDLRIDRIIMEYNTTMALDYIQMVHNHIFLYLYADYVPTARAYYVDVSYLPANGTQCFNNYTYGSFNNYIGVTATGCVNMNYNLLNCGGYSGSLTSIPAALPSVYLPLEPYNIFTDLNNFDGCCIGVAAPPIPAPPVPTTPNSSLPSSPSSLSYCLSRDQYQQCLSFCPSQCLQCNTTTAECQTCQEAYPYKINGQCQSSLPVQITVKGIIGLYLLNVNSWENFFYFIDNFKFHNYHRIQYDGIFRQVLEFVQMLQSNLWDLMQVSKLVDQIENPYPIASYSYYTNKKFEQVQRADSFFLQNTKDFFMINIPVVIILSIILNRLFYLLFNYKISILFRLYSIWMNIVFLIVCQNFNMLVFLACHHFTHVFSYDFVTRVLQLITISMLGLVFIIGVAFYLLCQYICQSHSKVFLANIYNREGAFTVMIFKFLLKSLLVPLAHMYLFDKPEFQLITISAMEFVNLAFNCGLQLSYSYFKSKLIFVTDCLLSGLMSIFNVLLYFKYFSNPELGLVFEQAIRTLLFCISVNVISSILVSLFLIFVKNRKKVVATQQYLDKRERLKSLSKSKATNEDSMRQRIQHITETQEPALLKILKPPVKCQINPKRAIVKARFRKEILKRQ